MASSRSQNYNMGKALQRFGKSRDCAGAMVAKRTGVGVSTLFTLQSNQSSPRFDVPVRPAD